MSDIFVALLAAAAPSLPQAAIPVADLNLTTPEGIARLDSRLAGAVQDLCPKSGKEDLRAWSARRACAIKVRTQLDVQRADRIARAQAERERVAIR